MDWISVEDSLPELDNDVLVWDGNFMSVMWIDRDEKKWKSMDSLYHEISYWMPLPKPPSYDPNENV